MRSEAREQLDIAINKLPEKEKQVLTLYYYKELTMKEVGTALGVGESRVSQIHSMAVKRLRSTFGELNDQNHAEAAATEPERARTAAAGT